MLLELLRVELAAALAALHHDPLRVEGGAILDRAGDLFTGFPWSA